MATHKVGATNTPTTMDYSTLQAWEDALPATLTEPMVAELYDQGELTAGVVISGVTTSGTNTITIRCATGAAFNDKAGVRTNALFYNASGGVAITEGTNHAIDCQVGHVIIQDLQVQISSTNYKAAFNGANTGNAVTVERCILKGTGTNSYGIKLTYDDHTFRSCLIMGSLRAVDSTRAAFHFCTLVRPGGTAGSIGLDSAYSDGLLRNSAIFNYSTVFTGTLETGSEYNATDGAGIGGNTGDLTGLTFASQFENTSNDFRAKITGSLYQAAITDGTHGVLDISKTTRTGSPTMGAWEVTAGGGGGPTVKMFATLGVGS